MSSLQVSELVWNVSKHGSHTTKILNALQPRSMLSVTWYGIFIGRNYRSRLDKPMKNATLSFQWEHEFINGLQWLIKQMQALMHKRWLSPLLLSVDKYKHVINCNDFMWDEPEQSWMCRSKCHTCSNTPELMFCSVCSDRPQIILLLYDRESKGRDASIRLSLWLSFKPAMFFPLDLLLFCSRQTLNS